MAIIRPYDDARDRGLVRSWVDSTATARWLTERDGGLSEADLDEWRDTPGLSQWMVERESRPVGHGALREEAGTYMLLCHLLVDPAQRGRGIGRELAWTLAKQARVQHPDWLVYTRLLPDNLPAILAYPSVGFVPLEPLEPGFDERFLWLVWREDDGTRVPGGKLDD